MNKIFAVLSILVAFQVTSAEIVDKVIATVDNEPILESDLTALREKAKNPFLLFDLLVDGDASTFSKTNRSTMIDYLINEKIVANEISRLGLTVSLEKADQEIKAVAKRNNVSVDEIYASFKKEGLTVSQYQDLMKNKMERDAFLGQEIISKIRISDDDVLAEYLKLHPDAKLAVNEFTVAHIFFDPKKPGGPEAALTRARDGYQKIKNGESFDKLAEKISEDPNFSAGGLLGTFKAGEFLPEIEARVATLKPGEVSDVVKSRIGFHLVKLISKKLATDPKFEKEKEFLKRKIEMVSIQKQFRNWLEKKKDDIAIKINEKK